MDLTERFRHNIEELILTDKLSKIAIAVSAGSDSVALANLAFNWANDKDIDLTIFYVNHNMRIESVEEDKFVKKLAIRLKASYYCLFWDGSKINSGFQERARKARYELLTKECCKLGIDHLLVGHHLDDHLELYLMKKKRKSSDLSLSVPKINFTNDIKIVRPVYNISKEELILYLNEKKISWMTDSSNESDKYERNRVRKRINSLSRDEYQDLIDSAIKSDERAEKSNKDFIKFFAETAHISPFGYATLDFTKLKSANHEMNLHLLSHLLNIIGGAISVPRYRNMRLLIELIESNKLKKSTLHGCVIEKNGNEILIYREISKIGAIHVIKAQDRRIFWDNRFIIDFNEDLSGYFVDHFGAYLYKGSSKSFGDVEIMTNNVRKSLKILPKRILFTLPVLRGLEKTILMPYIYGEDEKNQNQVRCVFSPKFSSRFTHFI